MYNRTKPVAGEGDPREAVKREFVITVTARPRESVGSVFSRLATALKSADATVVALFVYGDVAAREEATPLLRRYVGPIDWPVLWVEGASCDGALLAGVQAFAVQGIEVERVLLKGRVVGTMYSDGLARHCLLAGMAPANPRDRRRGQTTEFFETTKTALGGAGFAWADVVRTWFYNDQLLEWYGLFNEVRTACYREQTFRSGAVPASTGVSSRNPNGAALAAAVWAMQPLDGDARAIPVASPLQCPATSYGSSFSRAMELRSGARRRLLISGTASIAPDGRSLWLGDITRQVATTMEVVHAILTSRGMDFVDVARAVAYFKYPLDAAAFEQWQRTRGIRIPAVHVHCDICRDDLLFELELDAVR